MTPAVKKVFFQLLMVAACLILLAVLVFTVWRMRLDELIPQFLSAVPEDPFDGQPLRYKLLEKGYVVYSIGSDGEDNGGRERPANAKSSDQTHYDITFTVER